MSKEEVQFENLESRDRFEILAARHLRISLPSIESIRDRDDYRSTGVSDLWQFWQVIADAEASEIDRLNTVVEQQKNLIASLRAELRESYGIDAAVQEEHLDLEAAAKKLAVCMDYPWEHMPEQGRASMREHATAVIGAVLGSKQ